MNKNYSYIIGIDNGVSGALSILSQNISKFYLSKSYTKKCKSYTKKEQNITRIDVENLRKIIIENIPKEKLNETIAILERPLVNPTRFKASMSAMRSIEATLIVLEELGIDVEYTDSKVWQHGIFTIEERAKLDTKELSRKYGLEYYPQFKDLIEKQDADALLISHFFYDKFCNKERIDYE